MTTYITDCMGDILRITYDGHMWVSPHNGQQHTSPERAMRSEVSAYYRSCGEDVEDAAVIDEMEALISDMSSDAES